MVRVSRCHPSRVIQNPAERPPPPRVHILEWTNMAHFPVLFPWKKSQMCPMCMGNCPNLEILLAKWTNLAVFARKITNFGFFPTHCINICPFCEQDCQIWTVSRTVSPMGNVPYLAVFKSRVNNTSKFHKDDMPGSPSLSKNGSKVRSISF